MKTIIGLITVVSILFIASSCTGTCEINCSCNGTVAIQTVDGVTRYECEREYDLNAGYINCHCSSSWSY